MEKAAVCRQMRHEQEGRLVPSVCLTHPPPSLLYLFLVTGLELHSSLLSVSQFMPHLRYMQPFQGYEQRDVY